MFDEPEFELDFQTAAIIVASPGDETLWMGGTILMHPYKRWDVLCLSGANEPVRARTFSDALIDLGAVGRIGDLVDAPDEVAWEESSIRENILKLVGGKRYDRIFTHSPRCDYSTNPRCEQVGRAVISLWQERRLNTRDLCLFAYEMDQETGLSQATRNAHIKFSLRSSVWKEKYWNMTTIYGNDPESWEVRTIPCWEAFWRFSTPDKFTHWENRTLARATMSCAAVGDE